MTKTKKKIDFFETEEGIRIEKALRTMTTDKTYSTKATYSANIVKYPNNSIPFVNKHMNYIISHPGVDPEHYLANLRLMTRIS